MGFLFPLAPDSASRFRPQYNPGRIIRIFSPTCPLGSFRRGRDSSLGSFCTGGPRTLEDLVLPILPLGSFGSRPVSQKGRCIASSLRLGSFGRRGSARGVEARGGISCFSCPFDRWVRFAPGGTLRPASSRGRLVGPFVRRRLNEECESQDYPFSRWVRFVSEPTRPPTRELVAWLRLPDPIGRTKRSLALRHPESEGQELYNMIGGITSRFQHKPNWTEEYSRQGVSEARRLRLSLLSARRRHCLCH